MAPGSFEIVPIFHSLIETDILHFTIFIDKQYNAESPTEAAATEDNRTLLLSKYN